MFVTLDSSARMTIEFRAGKDIYKYKYKYKHIYKYKYKKCCDIEALLPNLAEVNYKCCTYEYLYFSKSQTLVRIWVWLDFNNFHDIGSTLRVWCCNSFEDTDLYYCWHFKSLGGEVILHFDGCVDFSARGSWHQRQWKRVENDDIFEM